MYIDVTKYTGNTWVHTDEYKVDTYDLTENFIFSFLRAQSQYRLSHEWVLNDQYIVDTCVHTDQHIMGIWVLTDQHIEVSWVLSDQHIIGT